MVSDLILLFFKIFEVDAAELSREKRMLEVLERYHSANSSTPQNKTSGDLKIWVYLEHKDSSNCVNVTVSVVVVKKVNVKTSPFCINLTVNMVVVQEVDIMLLMWQSLTQW